MLSFNRDANSTSLELEVKSNRYIINLEHDMYFKWFYKKIHDTEYFYNIKLFPFLSCVVRISFLDRKSVV